MKERPANKSHGCRRLISDLERFSWNALKDTLQIEDSFQHKGGLRFSWDNQQKGLERCLVRLDRIYTSNNKNEVFDALNYKIHIYALGSDHYPVKLELEIGIEEKKYSPFKWNTSHLKDTSLVSKIKDEWNFVSKTMPFFGKLRHIARIYR